MPIIVEIIIKNNITDTDTIVNISHQTIIYSLIFIIIISFRYTISINIYTCSFATCHLPLSPFY
ncbi:hypothetical protein [Spiroplasma endosymbiont of Acasis viretata]|uniref:hypothetical protein n=1 Tax=Spiroplasma endosymbiont of Acasis viretata TaxID=3066306 RepID=UPI00313D4515